jgi:galactose mutarotase-like enzyme
VITSAKTNRRSESFTLSQRDLPQIKTGPWSVRQTVLHGGKQEGVELITIDNGKLLITLIPTRGMSLLEVRSGALRLGWDSPVKEVVHPQFVDLESRGGLGWLDGFNEGMVRCGLEFAGHPGRDEFVDNTGAKAEMNLTLHGKIGNLPASEVEVVVDRVPPHRIRVRGIVPERSFHGPKLELAAEVSTIPGSDTFRIDDAVTNHGAAPQEFQLIYHANFGTPLLEKGATVVAPVARIAPMNDHAARAIDQYSTYDGPTAGFIEQVYLITPLADEAGRTRVLLRNAAKDQGASITWSTRELPYWTLWKNTAAEDDGYVTGLEPGTGFPFNRKVERQFGRVPKLSPGETRRFSLEFGLHAGREAVAEVAGWISGLARGREPQVETKPPVGH